jgi:hypothetical protein
MPGDDFSKEIIHLKLASLGQFYALNIHFDTEAFCKELLGLEDEWHPYNQSKPNYKRKGLSLFSLDGLTSGEIDLNSVHEYNLKNGTSFDEMSFNRPTQNWSKLPSLSHPLKELNQQLGRTHLIKFDKGGFFPPHRDIGNSFRLISFFNCCNASLNFTLDNKKIHFETGYLYFVDTRKIHSLFSFKKDATILILNVSLCDSSAKFVFKNLLEQ